MNKSVEQWLIELNDPQVERRRDTLTALADPGVLDDRLIDELKLIARGDPDPESQSLAKKVLKARGIKIFAQISAQPGARRTNLPWGPDFWAGFFLYPILNFVLYFGLHFFAPTANTTTTILQLGVDVALFIYFWLVRKNVALGMLAALCFIIVIVLCRAILHFFDVISCWPDGCSVLRQDEVRILILNKG